jgi:hypothetical protein
MSNGNNAAYSILELLQGITYIHDIHACRRLFREVLHYKSILQKLPALLIASWPSIPPVNQPEDTSINSLVNHEALIRPTYRVL